MSIKKVKDLKNKTLRKAGMEWAKALGIDDLTSKEWDLAIDLLTFFNFDEKKIKHIILAIRKNGWKWGSEFLDSLSKK